MGEAKRRKELVLPTKSSNQKKISREEKLFSWFPWPYISNESISLCFNCDYGTRFDFSNMGI
tara:strand:- start:325 stop:510 length:186 start_codon:yes stop_codon:yes gene_type:complete